MSTGRIIVDIETGPHPDLDKKLPPFNPDDVKLGNVKDPEKIKAKLDEAKANYVQDAINSAALSPFYGQIIAIGCLDGEAENIFHGYDEAKILTEFWAYYRANRQPGDDNVFVGFNSNGFDWPMLVKRSYINGVKPPRLVNQKGYLFDWLIDLRLLWNLGDRQAAGKLGDICKAMGLGEKTGDGKDFAATYAKDPKTALAYLSNDLKMTAKLADRLLA